MSKLLDFGFAKCWIYNEKYHREDGPAIEYNSGTKMWMINGNLHREDGPAITFKTTWSSWYLDDSLFSEKEYWKKINKYKLFKVKKDDKSIIVIKDFLMEYGLKKVLKDFENEFLIKESIVHLRIPIKGNKKEIDKLSSFLRKE